MKIIGNLIGYGTTLYIWAYGLSDFAHTHPNWTGVVITISALFLGVKLGKKIDY